VRVCGWVGGVGWGRGNERSRNRKDVGGLKEYLHLFVRRISIGPGEE
jgi:hypothetical protein